MPRRSRSAAQDTSVTPEARRTTRGSIVKPDESPVSGGRGSRRSGRAAAKKSPSPSPTRESTPSPVPAKREGRGAGRRAASGRPVRAATSRGKKAAEGSDEESEEEEEEEEFVPTTPRGGRRRGGSTKATPSPRGRASRAAKSPAAGRRKRKKPVEVDSEDDEEEWDPEEAEVKKTPTPVKSTSGRPQRTRRAVVEVEPEPESPSRRSSRRAAARTASACIEAQAAQDDKVEEAVADEEEEEEPAPTPEKKSSKRGIEEVEDDAPAEKKARVDESQEEMDAVEETDTTKQPSDETKDQDITDDATPPKPDSEEREAEAMEEDDEEGGAAETGDVPEAVESAQTTDTSDEKKTEAAAAGDDAPNEDTLSQKEETEASDEVSQDDVTEKTEESTEAEVTDAMETDAVEEAADESSKPDEAACESLQEETTAPADCPSNTTDKAAAEPDMSEYVIIGNEDVPAADSQQVKESLPQPTNDEGHDGVTGTEAEEPSSSTTDVSSAQPTSDGQTEDGDVTTSAETAAPTSCDEKTAMDCQPDSSSVAPPDTPSQQTNVSSSSNGLPPTSIANEISGKDEFTPTSNSVCNSGEESNKVCPSEGSIFSRELVYNPKVECSSVDNNKTFSVVSYNILADCHAQRDYTYDGVWISGEHLSMPYRHQLLMKELQYLDADIVCLQEVGPEHFHKMLVPSFKDLGYEGMFVKRTDDVHNEGEATFYRTSRFDLVTSRGVELAAVANKELELSGLEESTVIAVKSALDSPAVAMLTQLRCLNTNTTVSVANVHNMWDRFARQDLQSIMIASAVKELVNLAGGPDKPHIICGDFNSWPGSAVYQLTQEGYLNDSSMAALNNAPTINVSEGKDVTLVNLWWKGFQHTSSFKSAYTTVMGEEPLSSKFPHDGVMRAVDFIWFAGMDALAVAKMTPPDAIKDGVPNAKFPSDHLSTKALFSLK